MTPTPMGLAEAIECAALHCDVQADEEQDDAAAEAAATLRAFARTLPEERAFLAAARAYITHAIFGIEELPVVVEADAMRERHRLYEAMIDAAKALTLAEAGAEGGAGG